MQDKADERVIKRIIEDFPFRRQKDQKEKLARYIIAVPGASKAEIQELTGISQPTIREIQEKYSELDLNQKALFIKYFAEKSSDLEFLEDK